MHPNYGKKMLIREFGARFDILFFVGPAIDLVVAAVEADELDKPVKAAMDDRRSKLRRVK